MDQQDFANFTVQLNESFSLPPILRAITSAAEYNNHRMLALQFRQAPSFRRMVTEFVIGKTHARHNITPHRVEKLLSLRSVSIEMNYSFGKGLWSFLRRIVTDVLQRPS
jgi:hypothetical protein